MIAEPPLDAPDEDWAVWADAMQQLGDPRGELIALAKHPDQLAKHVKLHADRLLGPTLGRMFRKGTLRTTWRRAQPDVVELRLDDKANGPQLLAQLIQSPLAPRMRGLAIAAVPPRNSQLDLTQTLGALGEIPRSWTSLALIDDRARAVDHMITRDFRPHQNLVDFGALDTLWPAVQHLEELTLVVADPAQLRLAPLELPELRSFTLHCLYWTEGTGALLANARWPKLANVELRLVEDFTLNEPSDRHAYRPVYASETASVDEAYESTPRRGYVDRGGDLARLFESFEALPLERLAVTSFADGNLVLGLLENYALPSLVHLDLSDSALTASDLARLANNPLLLQLDELVLERVTAPTAKALVGAVEVRHSCSPRAPSYRYVVGWE